MSIFPVVDYSVSQAYGVKGNYRKGYHSGIDFISGNKNIYSPVNGTVIESRFASGKGADPSGWGNYIIVRTKDGFDTLYAHLSSVAVKVGQTVSSGIVLGQMGSTGNSTGQHLHFEVWQGDWKNRNDINPLNFLQGLSVGSSNSATGLSFSFPELKNPSEMSRDELLKMAGVGVLFLGAMTLLK